MTRTILHIDASARLQGSASRDLSARIAATEPGARVLRRDLAMEPVPPITEEWIAAAFTPEDSRTDTQRAALALSDALVAEIQAADLLVIGTPVYNFGLPAALKAWVDHVARAGLSFRYTETGPEGLLTGKRAIVAMASGGTPAGSATDFVTPYLRHMLGFLGIEDVTVIAADRMSIEPEASLAEARAQLARLTRAA